MYKIGDKVLVEATVKDAHHDAVMVSFDVGGEGYFHLKDIHSLAPEFKAGQMIEVSTNELEWKERVFICKLKGVNYCAQHNFDEVKFSESFRIVPWAHVRKIKLQPDDTMIWKDGKRYKLVEVDL